MRPRMSAAILVLLTLVGCGSKSDSGPDSVDTVTYRVDGSATSVAITYQNNTEGTSQITTTTPWTYSFQHPHAGQFLYVSAQNQNETGTVHVSITLNGSLFKESTSSGAFVIATASGSF
jgi:hypothetical protein